jgi:lycopene cyclase domain-containing protein
MSLYLLLLILSIIIPFSLSFDKKVSFFRYWNRLFPAMIITGAVFITADVYFVRHGVWGFNPDYHSDIIILGLPLEEWLFFIFIPYSCVFIHYVFIHYFPAVQLSDAFVKVFSGLLIVILTGIIVLNHDRTYTLFIAVVLIMTLVVALFDRTRLLNRYYISFIIILIPFFIVNGILTGTFIPGEVFWYNSSDIMGLRILTIPVEDAGLTFSLILMNLLLMNRFKTGRNNEPQSYA